MLKNRPNRCFCAVLERKETVHLCAALCVVCNVANTQCQISLQSLTHPGAESDYRFKRAAAPASGW